MKFYICEHCGNLITFVESADVPVSCCGQKMTELVPGSVDAAVEKHVPVIKPDGAKITVEVGSVEHPMLPEHYIQWIALETQEGTQLKYLSPGQRPRVTFALSDEDQALAAYAYCNIHGLWKAAL